MTDDVAGSLIAALGSEGEYIDDGVFTLDAVKAQAKLREYQLSDPHGYVLLLVEAAWLATRDRGPDRRARIAISAGATTRVVFDAISLPERGLANLFGVAIGDTSGLDADVTQIRVLQLLGLAANSALALEPRALTIEAQDEAGRTLRASVTADGVELEVVDAEPSPVREVQFVFRGSRLALDRMEKEQELVRARCKYSALEIRLDGERVSRGWGADIDPEQGPNGPVKLAGVEIGAAGYCVGFDEPRAFIVNRGVTVETLRPPGQAGLVAVVEVDLAMDLSRSQLQRGAEYDAIERAIQDALRGLPSARIRFNWSAIRTGDSRIVVFFVVFALIFVGFTYVLWLFLLSAFD